MRRTYIIITAIIGLAIVALGLVYFFELVQGGSKTLVLFLIAVLLLMFLQFARYAWNPKSADQAYHRQKWQDYKKKALARKSTAPDFDPASGKPLPPSNSNPPFALENWECSLTPLWDGSDELQFSYACRNGVKSQCTVTVESVLVGADRSFYLRGVCQACREPRIFNVDSIQGQVSCAGKRLEVYELFMERFGIGEEKVFFLNVGK